MTAVQERLVVDHLEMADRFAAKFILGAPAGIDEDAILGAAREALVRAALRFDTGRGVEFRKWAGPKIWWAIQDEARRLSPHCRGEFRAIRDGKDSRIVKRSNGKTVERPILREVSLDVPRTAQGDATLADTVSDGRDPYADVDDRSEALQILDTADRVLTGRERKALLSTLEYGNGRDVAAELGVTDGRVSQLRAAAIRKLRDAVAA